MVAPSVILSNRGEQRIPEKVFFSQSIPGILHPSKERWTGLAKGTGVQNDIRHPDTPRLQRGLLLPAEYPRQGVQAQQVGAPAEAGNLTGAGRGDQGYVAELLPGIDVAEMHFDHRQVDGNHRVAQRY